MTSFFDLPEATRDSVLLLLIRGGVPEVTHPVWAPAFGSRAHTIAELAAFCGRGVSTMHRDLQRANKAGVLRLVPGPRRGEHIVEFSVSFLADPRLRDDLDRLSNNLHRLPRRRRLFPPRPANPVLAPAELRPTEDLLRQARVAYAARRDEATAAALVRQAIAAVEAIEARLLPHVDRTRIIDPDGPYWTAIDELESIRGGLYLAESILTDKTAANPYRHQGPGLADLFLEVQTLRRRYEAQERGTEQPC